MIKLAQADVSNKITTLYTVPDGMTAITESTVVINNTKGDLGFSLWIVPGGSEPTIENALYIDQVIKAHSTVTSPVVQVLENTTSIQIQGSQLGLSIILNGVEKS